MYRKKDKHVIKSLKRNRYCGAKNFFMNIFPDYGRTLGCLKKVRFFAKLPLLASPMAVIHEEQGAPKNQCDKVNS